MRLTVNNGGYLFFIGWWKNVQKSQKLWSTCRPNSDSRRTRCKNCSTPNPTWSKIWPSRTTAFSLTGKSAWACAKPSQCHHGLCPLCNVTSNMLSNCIKGKQRTEKNTYLFWAFLTILIIFTAFLSKQYYA